MNDYEQQVYQEYKREVAELVGSYSPGEEGEHLWDTYQKVTAIHQRLGEIHNEIASMEIEGEDWPEIKKFRTLIVDPTVDRFEKHAAFESRKITARNIEFGLDK